LYRIISGESEPVAAALQLGWKVIFDDVCPMVDRCIAACKALLVLHASPAGGGNDNKAFIQGFPDGFSMRGAEVCEYRPGHIKLVRSGFGKHDTAV
jgi:hypothetical protein